MFSMMPRGKQLKLHPRFGGLGGLLKACERNHEEVH
jgi:hypothetical protein